MLKERRRLWIFRFWFAVFFFLLLFLFKKIVFYCKFDFAILLILWTILPNFFDITIPNYWGKEPWLWTVGFVFFFLFSFFLFFFPPFFMHQFWSKILLPILLKELRNFTTKISWDFFLYFLLPKSTKKLFKALRISVYLSEGRRYMHHQRFAFVLLT